MSQNDSLVALQMQVAHLERFVEQLNEVVTAQAKQIDRQQIDLDRVLRTVNELKTKSGSTSPETSIEDEKPPHY